ncbi:amino acid adenylation domain-containing protein [Synechococcus sp. CS-1332]|uniref:non-ribosomal peptide synthetase n=1 Tax=Synechococcus sp. CS-1332 TaxID=2847972 RepID=UPI00223AA381|nr:amino acid adenylation domain-containing protein [Synechococcus sp. CS-1332]MCT0208716.1 amino acid adenylation domain-containing protein [Synechococcus sp. CS-1332]
MLSHTSFPASLGQKRFYFLEQYSPGSGAYHVRRAWRLNGSLLIDRLQKSLDVLRRRHQALRTTLHLEGADVLQIIHSPSAWPMRIERVQPSMQSDSLTVESALQQRASLESVASFDMEQGPLVRALLLEVSENDHLLVITIHHAVCDGWSLDILEEELFALYESEDESSSTSDPASLLKRSEGDDHLKRNSQARLELLRSFWHRYLDGAPTTLDIPRDFSPPPTETFSADVQTVCLPASLRQQLASLAHEKGTTLYVLLLASFQVLLSRTSLKTDLLVGTPVAGRSRSSMRRLIGFFVNTLVIRGELIDDPCFSDYLDRLTSSMGDLFAHQSMPFEQLVIDHCPARMWGRPPLVQVMFAYNNFKPKPVCAKGVTVERFAVPVIRESFEIHMSIKPVAGCDGLHCELSYRTSLFSDDHIRRILDQWLCLLQGIVASPGCRVSALPLLPDGESRQLQIWSHGNALPLLERCAHQIFEQQAARTPEATALVYADQQLSYGALNARANQMAHLLRQRGVGPGVIVGLCLGRSFEMVVGLLAILKAGGIYFPLDPTLPEARLQRMLADADPLLLVVDGPACAVAALASRPLLNLGDDLQETDVVEPQAPAAIPLSAPAYLLYTSGSTGVPKGVLVPHRVLAGLVAFHRQHERLRPPARTLQFAGCGFDVSLQEVFGTLCLGGTLVLISAAQRRDPALLWKVIRAEEIERLFLPYVVLEQLALCAEAPYSRLRDVISAGEALTLSPAIRSFIGRLDDGRLHNHYGPTESHVVSHHLLPAAVSDWPLMAPIGVPLPNTSLLVLDAHLQLCPIGIPGELHIGGAGLALGYLNRPDLTSERFIPSPFRGDSTERLYRTGDLASWNADGTLAFHGRLDHQIKLRGFRIEPGEIEAALIAHPAIEQAVVLLRQDQPSNPQLVAYWIATHPSGDAAAGDSALDHSAAASSLSAIELGPFLAERLPEYMLPAAFVRIDVFPLTPNGKLDRSALPTPCFSGDLHRRTAPSTPLQIRLHSLWADVLGHGDFGIHDNFFAIGGHSLAAARLISRIEESLARTLPLAMIFHAPTIAEMLLRLEGEKTLPSDLDPCMVPLQALGEAIPLFVIHGFGGDVFCYTDFAGFLAPDRPVYGLQARGIDGRAPRHRSVEEMAEHYATLIEERWPQGPYHLLGQSAGGWYAYAVAAALLSRGRSIGMLAILDSDRTAFISRRLRTSLLLRKTIGRLPAYLEQLRHSKRPRNFVKFLQLRSRRLSAELQRFRPPLAPLPHQPHERTEASGQDYYDLLHRRYQPRTLPVTVHLFTTSRGERLKCRLWRAYACGGVHHRRLFEEHYHYHLAPWAADLAAAIREALAQQEAG